MAEVILTEQNFDTEVLKSDIPVLVDFWATWCGPCRMLAPVVEKIADEYQDRLKVGKVNVDEASGLAVQFQISSIPTLVLFVDGKPVERAVGYRPEEQVVQMFGDRI